MSTMNNFTTWDDVAVYIEDTLGITYTDNPTGWVEAMKELTKGYKYVSVVNDVTGETTTQLMKEDLVAGVGEIHIGDNTSSAYSVSGGGAKSVPTAKSIITNSSGGGTAVITEEATGIKDTGLVNGVTGINIINGLFQIYGLVHAGINIANAQVWKDMSNYVYDSDFTEDTPVERVIEFVTTKIVNTVTDLTSDGDIRVSIPDTIAQRMYDFLANHMVEEQIPEVHPDMGIFDTIYNFIQRTLVLADPTTYTLERYRSALNPTAICAAQALNITDDLFKSQLQNFIEQAIGSGFNIASSVAAALLASMNGIMAFLKERSVDAVDAATIQEAEIIINRGSTPPTKDTPVSLAEFEIYITCYRDDRLPKSVDPEGNIFYDITVDTTPYYLPSLAAGYSYQNGDCVKYLQRGKSGSEDNDYAYVFKYPSATGTGEHRYWSVGITYPANVQTFNYSSAVSSDFTKGHTNGFPSNKYSGDFTPGVPDVGIARYYNNIGYSGYGYDYTPDDYLVTAGIKSKVDSSGNHEKHPDPNKSKEARYQEMQEKKQQANPQVTDGDEPTVENSIKEYVPVPVPFGNENAKRSIEHGLNNPDDPESYQDDRPQDIKLQGRVNTEDPIDGYNEDTDNVIKSYNESRNDPEHYPEPIPANEPNPQYPTNPPAETDGDSGDSPTPATLPGVTASGMVSVYNPTKQQVINFSGWLWTNNVIENLKKILANPMDAIIGMHIMYATPVTGSAENIICGYLDSGVAAKVVTQQYIDVDCGEITIPEFYGNVFDYEPYTTIHVYLPFVGIQSLKANDVVGKKLAISYGVDVLTGTCLARLTTKKGESVICCYQFPGNCAVQIPLTGGNYAEIIKSIASMAIGVAGTAVTGNPLPAIGGVIGGAMAASFDVSRSGSLGANAGVMGIRKPYVIITRRVGYEAAAYSQYYGFPANKTVILGNCTGYTRVKAVHIETIPVATDNEKTEIETLLKQGVIIR